MLTAKLPSHGVVLLAMSLAVLVAQVDTSVANLAVRAIGADLHAGIGALQWVIDAYNLVYAVLLLTGGLLADLYGRRRIFLAGVAIFSAASLACAAAPGIGSLIAGRAVAGIGAALTLPASLAIIRVVWPDEAERGRVLGIWAACNGLALAVGPTLGGVLIGRFGWRSVFLVVVPLGVAALALAARAVPESADPQGRRFDPLGQALGAITLGGLALAAIEGYGTIGPGIVALMVAMIALAGFVAVERRAESAALVPLDLFRARPFRGAMVATAAMTFGMYGVLFLLPLSWQEAGGLGVQAAGLALLPMALVFVLVSPRSGPLAQRVGTHRMIGLGVALIGCGLLILSATRAGRPIALAELGLVLTGLGMGLATGPLFGVAVAAVGAERSGTASALINVARMVGATLGVAALGAAYAVPHGGAMGLRVAMLAGAAIQLAGAALAFATIRPAVPARARRSGAGRIGGLPRPWPRLRQ